MFLFSALREALLMFLTALGHLRALLPIFSFLKSAKKRHSSIHYFIIGMDLFVIFFLLFSGVSRVLECRGGLLENGILSGVPFGQHPFFFEPSVFPSVVNGGEYFPHKDEGETDGHDGPDDAQDDAHDVDDDRTLFGSLHPDLQPASQVVIAVDKGGPAFVVINKGAQPLVFDHVVFGLFHFGDLEVAFHALRITLVICHVYVRA